MSDLDFRKSSLSRLPFTKRKKERKTFRPQEKRSRNEGRARTVQRERALFVARISKKFLGRMGRDTGQSGGIFDPKVQYTLTWPVRFLVGGIDSIAFPFTR